MSCLLPYRLYDTPLGQEMAGCTSKTTSKTKVEILEKNFCFLGFADSATETLSLSSEMN
jgi:hypothetical protein